MNFSILSGRKLLMISLLTTLLIPTLLWSQDCVQWEEGVEPIFTFGEEYGYPPIFGDSQYQMFTKVTTRWDGFTWYDCYLLDVSNPFDPTLVWEKIHEGIVTYDWHYMGSFADLVFVARTIDGTWFGGLTIQNLEPEPVSVTIPCHGWRSSYRRDNIIWILMDETLTSYDLNDWPNLEEVGSIAVEESTLYMGPQGAIVAGYSELHFLDLDDPANPRIGGSYRLHQPLNSVTFTEGVAYLGDDSEVTAVDYSDFTQPERISRFLCPVPVGKVEVYDSEGILFFKDDSFQVVSLLDPKHIVALSGKISAPTPSAPTSVRSGDLLYLGCGHEGVALYDLTDPSSPQLIGQSLEFVHVLNIVDDLLVCGGIIYPLDCPEISPVADQPASAPVRLIGAVPNPFNPRTAVKFTLDQELMINLRVYDLSGRCVRALASESWPAGENEAIWDGRDNTGRELPSGTYFFNLQAGETQQTCRAVLLR